MRRLCAYLATVGLGLAIAVGCVHDTSVGSDGYKPRLRLAPAGLRDVDILFVVDDSPSMGGPQQKLASSVAALFRGIDNELGALNLHVAVITTDTGACGGPVPGFHTCEGMSGDFLSVVLTDDEEAVRNFEGGLEDRVACLAEPGTTGCGWEHPLDAMAQGVVAEGFARDNAALVIVFVTDEDDCSAADPSLFEPQEPIGPLSSMRCVADSVICDQPINEAGVKTGCVLNNDPTYLTKVSDHVDLVGGLNRPAVFVELIGASRGSEFVLIEEDDSNLFVESVCADSGSGAWPMPRLHAFVEGVGGMASGDVCAFNYEQVLTALAERMSARLRGPACLEGAVADVSPTPGIQHDCRVFDVVGDKATAVPRCDPAQLDDCYEIEEDVGRCPDTQTHLAVGVRRVKGMPANSTLLVECIAP